MKKITFFFLILIAIMSKAQKGSFKPFWQLGIEAQTGYWKPYNKFDKYAPAVAIQYKKNVVPNILTTQCNVKYFFSKYLGVESGIGYQQNKQEYLSGQFTSGGYSTSSNEDDFYFRQVSPNAPSITTNGFRKIALPLGIIFTSSDYFIEQFEAIVGLNFQYVYHQQRFRQVYQNIKNGDTTVPFYEYIAIYQQIDYKDRDKLNKGGTINETNLDYIALRSDQSVYFKSKRRIAPFRTFLVDAYLKLNYKKTFDNNFGFTAGGYAAITLMDIENKKAYEIDDMGNKQTLWNKEGTDLQGNPTTYHSYANNSDYGIVQGYNGKPLKYPTEMKRPKTIAHSWGLNFGIHYQFR
jgi:hypothetical protein